MIYLSAFSLVRSFCSPGTLTNEIASILFYFEATNRIGLFCSLQNENEQRRIKKLFLFQTIYKYKYKGMERDEEAHLFLREYKYI